MTAQGGDAVGVSVARDAEIEAIYREAAPALWRSLYGYAGGRRQIAEDALAEAFALAIEAGDRIRTPLPWIYRTAFRLATRELRAERRPRPEGPDPAPGLDPAEVRDIVVALRALPDRQRAAVILHDQEGFTGPEIARMLGISAATVRVHLVRGRARLRTLLEENSDG
jgi:RNA polymerase sigma-70 factor (ECF subfamily)